MAADTFKITAYSAATDTATITFIVNDTTYANYKVQGVPKDTVANVKTYLRNIANAYLAGKAAEDAAKASPSAEVAALLGVATEF